MGKFTVSNEAINKLTDTVNQNPDAEVSVTFRICAFCSSSTIDKLQQCTGCKVTYYCNTDCQKKDWSLHKTDCKEKQRLRPSNIQLQQYSESLTNDSIPDHDSNVRAVILCITKTEVFLRLKALPLCNTSNDKEGKLPYRLKYYTNFGMFTSTVNQILKSAGAASKLLVLAAYKQLTKDQYILLMFSVDTRYCSIKIIKK